MMRGVHIVVFMVSIATMCGCIAPQNALMVGVDMHSWSREESLTYENVDTLSLRNLNVALRYNDNFKRSTLPLKIAVTTPDARHFEEVVELQLAHPSTALTVATTESVPYRTNVVLNQKGSYTFSFEPQTEVQGVEAIGVEFN